METDNIHIEILDSPRFYSPAQMERAWRVAKQLNRGKLLLVETPAWLPQEQQAQH